MLFNSFEYILFLPIVFLLYWFIFNQNTKARNLFLLFASYFFYSCWDWRFVSIIFASSLLDFSLGILIEKNKIDSNRKLLLLLSLTFNVGILCVFKYYNFFVDSFVDFSSLFGLKVNLSSINVILPVGISFYTFQTLSYTIDIYRKRLKPTKDIIAFFSFVSFFPQLVAGPIERASNLLPQFFSKKNFIYDNAVDGTRQILWGLFKKVVVADNCSIYVNEIFGNYGSYNSLILVLGALLFAFQIYGDFSGYSDIAIGTAKLFGFNLKQNFAFPYFSRDIAEFWRKWHISLSSWFRDYLYIPLGGSKQSKIIFIRNIFIIFIVSGFWHGANFTFVIWGTIHALYFLPQLIRKTNRRFLNSVAKDKLIPNFKELLNIIFTFLLTSFAWIFFRAKTVTEAINYIIDIFSLKYVSDRKLCKVTENSYLEYILPICILTLILFEWHNRTEKHGLSKRSKYLLQRWATYTILILVIVQYFGSEQNFIYFQF